MALKKTPLLAALVATVATSLLAGCGDDVGKVSLGVFTTKDVIIDAKTDPKLPGVTCHISRIEANLDFADPSDMSISCRQTGPITNGSHKHALSTVPLWGTDAYEPRPQALNR